MTSIYINYPPLLLRKKTLEFPDGRTSYKFKNFLRSKITIIDKNAVKVTPPVYVNKTFNYKDFKKGGTTKDEEKK